MAAPGRPAMQFPFASRIVAGVGWAALAGALAVAAGAALAGWGHRQGWWDFRTGFDVLRWSSAAAVGAAGFSLSGIVAAVVFGPRRSLLVLVPALALATVTFAVPWLQLQKARSVPPIHDISTDTEDPPQFVAALALRRDAPNPSGYGGPRVAEQQRRAYPDIAPRTYALPPQELFRLAAAAARELGWQIVAEAPQEGRIEATATTFWFGFKDDVVIRITALEEGSRLDVRSVSRVGRSDVGANAARIRAFLAALPAPAGR